MTKSISRYWNPLQAHNTKQWKAVDGLEDLAEQITLSFDEANGE